MDQQDNGLHEDAEEEMLCVGVLAGAFGVHGEVRVKSFCAEPTDIADYNPLCYKTGQEVHITLTRPIKSGFAARVSGIKTKEQADEMRGVELFAPRDAFPNLPDDEFYHADLIGLDVVDTGGAKLGRVRAVHDFGAGDVLEVIGVGLKASAMLPFTRAAVPTVDLSAGRVVADPPEGVFPDPEAEAREKAEMKAAGEEHEHAAKPTKSKPKKRSDW